MAQNRLHALEDIERLVEEELRALTACSGSGNSRNAETSRAEVVQVLTKPLQMGVPQEKRDVCNSKKSEGAAKIACEIRTHTYIHRYLPFLWETERFSGNSGHGHMCCPFHAFVLQQSPLCRQCQRRVVVAFTNRPTAK